MANFNLVDLGKKPASKQQIYQEENKIIKTKKIKLNFDNIFPVINTKNMGMMGIKGGMFGEAKL